MNIAVKLADGETDIFWDVDNGEADPDLIVWTHAFEVGDNDVLTITRTAKLLSTGEAEGPVVVGHYRPHAWVNVKEADM
jgi:hypothetical protein